MKTTIRKTGDSLFVVIPRQMLARAGLGRKVELTVERGAIVLRKSGAPVRAGWADAAKKAAASQQSTTRRLGLAKGLFDVPDSIDESNEEVRRMFSGGDADEGCR